MRAGIMNISQHKQNENVSPLPNKSAPLSDRLVYTHVEPDQEYYFHLAPVVHRVHPGSCNFDVNNVLLSDPEI